MVIPLALAAAAAGAISAWAKRRTRKVVRAEETDLSVADYLREKTSIHVDSHKGVDVRATVLIAVYVTLTGALFDLVKDSKSLLPPQLLLVIASLTTLGGGAAVVAAFVSLRNVDPPRTPEEHIAEAKRARSDVRQIEYRAAKQLCTCERITRRKSIWTDISLVLFCVDLAVCTFGVPLSLLQA